jgi:hypothetical protein
MVFAKFFACTEIAPLGVWGGKNRFAAVGAVFPVREVAFLPPGFPDSPRFARLAGRIMEARATTTIAIKAAVIFRFISLLLGKTRVCGSAVCRVWRFGKRDKAKSFDFKR